MNEEVYKLIPHRPPFLFVDEIVSVDTEKAVCKRVIRSEEPHFEGHYPGNPIMPGVLLCESVFQTAGIYLSKKLNGSSENSKSWTPILSRIQEAKFKQMVKPGDEIIIEAQFKETLSKFHFFSGKVTRDNKPVMTVNFAVAMIENEK